MTVKTRFKKLIDKLNQIDGFTEHYNPVLVNVVGGEIWGQIALVQDSNVILHQDCDYIEYMINKYSARADKSIRYAQELEEGDRVVEFAI